MWPNRPALAAGLFVALLKHPYKEHDAARSNMANAKLWLGPAAD
jgi:hypothetical protein